MSHKKEVQEYNKISQHFHNILLFNFYIHSIFRTNLGKKLLLVLKLCIKKKKKQTKRQYKKIVHETYSEFWLTQFDYIY